MEESLRDGNKTKRSKHEVKNVLNSYLQKRNYSFLQPFEVTKNQHLSYSQIENEVARSNSILYSCSNSDPNVIDQNFTKFSTWLKEQREKDLCTDLDQIVGPLFCHFCIEILKGDHKEKAGVFFRSHLGSFERNNCDPFVKELIKLFASDADISDAKELFRSKKIVITLTQESLDLFKKFVLDNCHVVFLQVLQNWFEFCVPLNTDSDTTELSVNENTMQEIENFEFEYSETLEITNEEMPKSSKIQNLLKAIVELRAEPIPIFCATLGRSKNFVPAGVLRRQAGLVAFAEQNVLNLMPLNSLDNLINIKENVERLKFTDHKERIYSIDLSYGNTILATASSDHTACIYDLNNMKLLHKCEGHSGPVYAVKISFTSEFIVTGSADHTARLWETVSGRTLRLFVGHMAPITCLDFHPNCLYMATGSSDRNIRMWCLTKAVTLRLLHGCKAFILAVSYSPAGKYLASASDDRKIRIWDLLTSKAILELRCDGAPVYRLIWNKTGRELCAGSNDTTIRIWDLGKMQDNDWENGRQLDPNVTRKLVGRLLNLEYAFGTYGALSVME